MPPKRASSGPLAASGEAAASSATKAAKRQRRQLDRRNTEEVVDRMLSERFQGFALAQTDMKQVEGLTLRQRLMQDLRDKRKDGAQRVATQPYIQRLRGLYTAEEGLLKSIAANAADEVSSKLREALELRYRANPAKRSRTLLYSFISAAPTLNQRELVGLLKSLGEKASLVSQSHRAHVLHIMRFLVSKSLDSKFPLEVGSVKAMWDDCLTMVYASARKDGDTHKFWTCHADVAALVLHVPSVTALLEAKGRWMDHKDVLFKVVHTSTLGRKMFQAAANEVLREEFSCFADAEIVRQRNPKQPLTRRFIVELKETLLRHADKLCGKLSGASLVGQMEASVKYRGLEVQCRVGDHVEEVDLKLGALIKEMAVGQVNGVDALAWEAACFSEPCTGSALPSDIPLMREYQNARVTANEALQSAQAKTGSQYNEVLQNKASVLKQLDRSFMVELAALKLMVESRGPTRLQDQVLDCMPSETSARVAGDVVDMVTHLREGNLYKFVAPSARASIDGAREFLLALESGGVQVKDVPAEGFMREILNRSKYFARFMREDSASAGQMMLFGAEALEETMARLAEKSKTEDGITVDDLEVPTMLAFLLPAKTQELLQQLTGHTIRKAMGVAAAADDRMPSATLAKTKLSKKKHTEDVSKMVSGWFA